MCLSLVIAMWFAGHHSLLSVAKKGTESLTIWFKISVKMILEFYHVSLFNLKLVVRIKVCIKNWYMHHIHMHVLHQWGSDWTRWVFKSYVPVSNGLVQVNQKSEILCPILICPLIISACDNAGLINLYIRVVLSRVFMWYINSC